VEVRRWTPDFPAVEPAGLVIEAFACKLPDNYIEAMAAQAHKPVWINLEYLSAEAWVHGCHGLPSPHPQLPLTKYFFFPGFTVQTGGLLLERDLLARRDAFQANGHGKDAATDDETRHARFPHPGPLPQAGEGGRDSLREFHVNAAQQAFWRAIGIDRPAAQTLKVSLFGYENAALHGLFDAWANGAQSVLCLVPEGRILPQVRQYFGDMDSPRPLAGRAQRGGRSRLGERGSFSRGNLQVRVLPFVEQERYDELLWACDVNFVRGEDSFVRAQWAGRPFVWQIYPQQDEVHLQKLAAFLDLYGVQLSPPASRAVAGMWQAWNPSAGSGQAAASSIGQGWSDFAAVRGELDRHAQGWARQLAENNLALNLLAFSRKIGRMRGLKIEGQ
jgi:hypothetical protein